jgi:hypothetical protein
MTTEKKRQETAEKKKLRWNPEGELWEYQAY